jgi:hypothetical protein
MARKSLLMARPVCGPVAVWSMAVVWVPVVVE